MSVAAPPAASDKDEQAALFSKYVDKDGQISRPTDYREKFTFLGSYAVATNPKEPLDELHNVYARPEDIDAYQRDGKFADGTVLVKEVTGVATEKLTTGQSHWATDTKLWFVMVKDSKDVLRTMTCGVTVGGGRSSTPISLRKMSQVITPLTARRATCLPKRTTGSTFAAIPCLRKGPEPDEIGDWGASG